MKSYSQKLKKVTREQLNIFDKMSNDNTEIQFLDDMFGIIYVGEGFHHVYYFSKDGSILKKMLLPNFLIYSGQICPYCGGKTCLIDSLLVYGKSFGNIRLCHNCRAYVGVHKDNDQALGRLADSELRKWKIEAHKYFDQIYKTGLINKINPVFVKNTTNRKKAYDWLAMRMNIETDKCHIGYFSINQCKIVVEICKLKLNEFNIKS